MLNFKREKAVRNQKNLIAIMMRHFLFSACMIALCFLESCAPKTSENRLTPLEKKVLNEIGQAKMGQVSGPIALSYRKLDLEEISAHLEMDEEYTKKHLAATHIHGYYSLIAKNYPPGEEFTLYQIDLSKRIHSLKPFYVGQNGTLSTPLDNLFIPIERNYVFFSNYLPGEPSDFVLGSKDCKYFAAARIVPNPILSRNEENQTLSIEIDSPDKRSYLIHCSGLRAFKPYRLIAAFENEKFLYTVESNERGEIFQSTGPTIPWAAGGSASVELIGEESLKPLRVQFEWGHPQSP